MIVFINNYFEGFISNEFWGVFLHLDVAFLKKVVFEEQVYTN